MFDNVGFHKEISVANRTILSPKEIFSKLSYAVIQVKLNCLFGTVDLGIFFWNNIDAQSQTNIKCMIIYDYTYMYIKDMLITL